MPIPDLVCVFVHKSENYLFSFHCRVIREQRLFLLHGHTQNSGLVNLIPESRLPLVPISTFPLTEKWPRRPEIGIKDDCFKEMEREYMYSIPKKKKTGLSFQMFSCSRKFSAGSNQKRVFPIYFPFGRGFPETFREMVKTNIFARAAHFL